MDVLDFGEDGSGSTEGLNSLFTAFFVELTFLFLLSNHDRSKLLGDLRLQDRGLFVGVLGGYSSLGRGDVEFLKGDWMSGGGYTVVLGVVIDVDNADTTGVT